MKHKEHSVIKSSLVWHRPVLHDVRPITFVVTETILTKNMHILGKLQYIHCYMGSLRQPTLKPMYNRKNPVKHGLAPLKIGGFDINGKNGISARLNPITHIRPDGDTYIKSVATFVVGRLSKKRVPLFL